MAAFVALPLGGIRLRVEALAPVGGPLATSESTVDLWDTLGDPGDESTE